MKIGKFLLAVPVFFCLLFPLAACAGGEEAESELHGTFTYQETINRGLTITHREASEFAASQRQYLFSNFYPINAGCEGTPVAYNMDQRLKLNRDFTYSYEYSVLLSNPGDWGGQFARLAVSITGTFEYVRGSETEYSVLLSDPTGGTETIYGATLGFTGIYGWSMHVQPDLILDFSLLSARDGYVCDVYARGRVVTVDRASHALGDDVFYPQLLNDIARYSTY